MFLGLAEGLIGLWRWCGGRLSLWNLWFWWLDLCGDGLKVRGRVSARRPRYFSLLRQRKVSKRKATLLSATPTLRCGATWVGVLAGWAAELALLLRSAAQTAAASQITKRGHPSVSPRTPPAALLGTDRGDGGNDSGHCFARPGGALTPALSQGEREEDRGRFIGMSTTIVRVELVEDSRGALLLQRGPSLA